MAVTPGRLDGFTSAEVSILSDMLDEWNDRDRHGLLESERQYDAEDMAALASLNNAVHEARKRRIIF